ncbi:histidinol-phosphate transaminase [Pontiella sulfatireligans]|uniref:Histidinol-phosphate aminotransferase n=1 Tax=Pontiella sulfatireligans TaxID=2750658 RepID=A0A6C2USK7_9BACT|nr:histidinol-phosphate transaminase [Pontiella sulfatireligans]VGO22933.1 Histidinol-phosphate aminotransferase [Pontiella sulfatireligans]
MKAKDWISDLRVYEPGKPIEEVARELGFDDIADIVKVASNENELGPSPMAIEAMQEAIPDMHRYPDGGAFYLKRKLVDKIGVEPEQLLFGCGSNELIIFLCHVFMEQGKNLVMGAEAFAVYFLANALYQGETIRVPMPDHVHDLEGMLAAITPDTRLVCICNPNNPTGTIVSAEAIDAFIEKLPDHVVAVFDEAYFEVMPEDKKPDVLKHIRAGKENIIVLRTFSKAYGLAGLRIGYAVGHPKLIGLLNKVRQPFNVNAMAQAAAMAALDDNTHIVETREMVFQGLAFFERELPKLGIETVPSGANFILVKTGNGREVFQKLQKRKVIVRPMDPYGLPDHIRITIGTPEQNQTMLNALKAVMA